MDIVIEILTIKWILGGAENYVVVWPHTIDDKYNVKSCYLLENLN